MLPEGVDVRVDKESWTVPLVFKLIQDKGNVDAAEMYRVFNMGIGMALICTPDDVPGLIGKLPKAKVIGEVVKQQGSERVIIA